MTPSEPSVPPSDSTGSSFAAFLHSWRYFFWLLALVLVGVLLFAEENWRGHWAWNRYKRELAAKGEKIELSAVIPPPVPDDKNFAMTPFLAPLFDFIPGTQKWPGNNPLDSLNHFASNYDAASRDLGSSKATRTNSWVKERTDFREWYAAVLKSKSNPGKSTHRVKVSTAGGYRFGGSTNSVAGPSGEAAATNYTDLEAAQGVLKMLTEADPVLDELRAASQLPYARFNLRYEHDDPAEILLPHLAVVKHLCKVLQLRACAELAVGQPNAAFQDTELILYLADVCRDEPFVISELVRAASMALACQPIAEGMEHWSEPQLRAFQDRLGKFDFCADTRRMLKAERYWSTAIIAYVERSPEKVQLIESFFNNQSSPGIGLGANLLSVVPDGWFEFEKLNCCRIIEESMLPAIDTNQRVIRPDRCDAASARIANQNGRSLPGVLFRHQILSLLLLSGELRVPQKAAFAQAGADCVRIACGLELYRRANGQLPEKLQELVPRFLEQVPTDIVNGEPLKYRREADAHYVLYSVGWNSADDGGVPAAGQSGQDSALAEGDWVWRLP